MKVEVGRKQYEVDLSKGFDIMRGKTVLDHAENYEVARRKREQYKGATIRYYYKIESKGQYLYSLPGRKKIKKLLTNPFICDILGIVKERRK